MSELNLLKPSDQQENTMDLSVHSTPSIQSDETGQTLTEEQLDFERVWAYNLEKKYGIREPFAD